MKFPFLTELVYDYSSDKVWDKDSKFVFPEKIEPSYIKISILDKWDSRLEPYFTANKIHRSIFNPTTLLTRFSKFVIFCHLESDDVYLLEEKISIDNGMYISLDQDVALLGNMYGSQFVFNGYKSKGPFYNLCTYLIDNYNETHLRYDAASRYIAQFIEEQITGMLDSLSK